MVELVIKLKNEDYYNIIKSDKSIFATIASKEAMMYSIKNGVLLPKDHGDLIDRDILLEASYCFDDWSGNEVNIVDVITVKKTPTIIKAENNY